MNGKGSTSRPIAISADEYRRRWDETFGNGEEGSIYLTPDERRAAQDGVNMLATRAWMSLDEAIRRYPPK